MDMKALKWAKSRKGQQTLIILAFMIIPLTLLFVFTYLPFGEMVKFSFYDMKYSTPVELLPVLYDEIVVLYKVALLVELNEYG